MRVRAALKVMGLRKEDFLSMAHRGTFEDGVTVLAFPDQATAMHFRLSYKGAYAVTHHQRSKVLLELASNYQKRVAKLVAKHTKLLDKTKAELAALKKGWNPVVVPEKKRQKAAA